MFTNPAGAGSPSASVSRRHSRITACSGALTAGGIKPMLLECNFRNYGGALSRGWGLPPNAIVLEAPPRHIVRLIDIAQVNKNRLLECRLESLQVECAELFPFGYDDQCISVPAA